MGVHFLTRHRNPLAYPAGYAPGFDPSHPAARGMSAGHGFSAVAAPAMFRELMSGRVFAGSGTFVSSMRVGPTVNLTTGASYGALAGNLSATDSLVTMAFIAMPTLSASGNRTYYIYNGGNTLGVQNTSTEIVYDVGGTRTAIPGTDAANNQPIFAIVSTDHSTILHGLTLNLNTGKIGYGSATVNTAGASAGTYIVGNGAAFPSSAHIAAAMFSPCLLSRSDMFKWSADPWSFWYPNRDEIYYGASAAALSARRFRWFING